MSDENVECLICKKKNVKVFDASIQGITGDSKIWSSTGQYAICHDCGHLQKKLTDDYKNDVSLIYKHYGINTLQEGRPGLSFGTAGTVPKMEKLINLLKEEIGFPEQGKLLDFGCNNGNFLKIFGRLFPNWILWGLDTNASKRNEVLSIPGVEQFYTSTEDITEQFDFITLINVVEHLFDPVNSLKRIKERLNPNGFLLIHVPNIATHPFDLPIVDHCSHFCIETLMNLLALAGFEIVKYSDKWVNKEIGVVVRAKNDDTYHRREADWKEKKGEADVFKQSKEYFLNGLNYIENLVGHASEFAKENKIGMLGVAIDGTYIGSQILEDLDFFVDENSFYAGKEYMGKPILSLKDIPANSCVYLPFPYDVAFSIKERFKVQYPNVNCILPLRSEGAVINE